MANKAQVLAHSLPVKLALSWFCNKPAWFLPTSKVEKLVYGIFFDPAG